MKAVRSYEGVRYHRYVVHYVLEDGRRRRKVVYAPGDPWVREAFDRWLHDADVAIRPGSNAYVKREEPPASGNWPEPQDERADRT